MGYKSSTVSTGAKVAGGAVLGGAAVAAGAYALSGDEVSDKKTEIEDKMK